MKLKIPTAVLLLVLGTAASIYARQEKGSEGHPDQAKPAQLQRQAKPAERQQTQKAKPEPQQHAQQAAHTQQQQRAKPVKQQQAQKAKPEQQQQTKQATHTQMRTQPVTRAQQGKPEQNQARAQQSRPAVGNKGGGEHGRISNAHYAQSFGSGHSFRVNQGDYRNRRFQYGGYSFGFVDPWPIAWGYSDDVYVVYVDGGYYMYDRVHPGVRISISIL